MPLHHRPLPAPPRPQDGPGHVVQEGQDEAPTSLPHGPRKRRGCSCGSSKFLGREKLPWEASSLEVEHGNLTSESAESVYEPPQKTSTDSEAATLADIPSLEDEVRDPLSSSSSSVGHEEEDDPSLHSWR
ncbi:uncharacterized protein LOC103277710 [Anolis carolinensis]|uniref:uncharacterized protein LOC103277710 n=1 Tax=Anolis carolinensis TaxID=28377 RepID=UPI002F2B567A